MSDPHSTSSARTDSPETGLVSAIIIFWNAERYLAEAIDSVLAQSYPNWELLLVDDGSTDGSATIARAAAERDPDRIRYLRHPDGENHGMSASRNLGIDHARGEWIAFLDADDVWLPFKLDHQIELIERHPEVGMVYGPTEYWYGWTGRESDRDRDFHSRLAVESDRVIQPPELLVRALETQGGMLPGICSLLVRRAEIERVGAFEPAFRGSYEDQVFFAKLFRNTRILVTDRCSDRYRQHDESCCAIAQKTGEYDPERPHPAKRRYLEWLDAYLARHPLPANDRWRTRLTKALRAEWRPYRHPVVHTLTTKARDGSRALKKRLRRVATKLVPAGARQRVRRLLREGRWVPPRGFVRLGSLGKLAPVSRDYGSERGLPIDRYYIEGFLGIFAADIHGRVLEVGDSAYTRRFGGEAVHSVDVLNIADGPGTTIVADLSNAPQIPDDSFDCIVLTQTLQYLFDLRAAVATLHRILKPGGVVLATAPGLTQIVECAWRDSWHWGLTSASATALFHERFPQEMVRVTTPGNVVTTTAFLQGLATEDLPARKLDHDDPDYQLLVTIRAQKPTPRYLSSMSGRWDYAERNQSAYGNSTTYRIGMEFLDEAGATVEDWGCGLGFARQFVKQARYIGLDGSPSPFADRIVDLARYRSHPDCVFMRHVLEHNPNWQPVLDNALASFRQRMSLIVFTPFVDQTRTLATWSGIPDIAFRKEDLTDRFPADVVVSEQSLTTDTQYGVEHVFLLERAR